MSNKIKKIILSFVIILLVAGVSFELTKIIYAMIVVVDSYSESYTEQFFSFCPICDIVSLAGQSFTASVSSKITSVKFNIGSHLSPTGNVVAKLYSHSGTYGTSSVPGSLLATSDNVLASSISSTPSLVTFVFSGANQYQMISGTHYVITLEYSDYTYNGDLDEYNTIFIGNDFTTLGHSGNAIYDNVANPNFENPFYVYGDNGVVVAKPAPVPLMIDFN
jgi:hypothetical protein